MSAAQPARPLGAETRLDFCKKLEVDLVRDTLNVLLKFEADIEVANKQLATLTQKAKQEAGLPG